MSPRALGVNTYGYLWSPPLIDVVRRLGGLGYRRFEAVLNPPHLDLEMSAPERRALRQAVAAAGATIGSLNLPSLDTNLASALKRMRDYSVDVFRDAIDLAADLGIERLVTVPGRVNPLLAPSLADRDGWMRESLAALIPHAQSRGVGLAIENVPFASFPDAPSLARFVRGVGSPTLSVCYDAANAHFIGESPAAGLRELRELVSIVHLSDTTRSAWRHDEVGQGDVPFDELPAALDEIGFEGDCMLEIIATPPEAAILRSHARLVRVGFAPSAAARGAAP